MKYIVMVREVHIQGYEVEADSPENAKEKVFQGNAYLREDFFEYSYTLDSSLWTVDLLDPDSNHLPKKG